MIFWTTINIATGVLVSAIVVYMLSAYHERFTIYERLAMVGVSSGMILRIGPIVGNNILSVNTPYDDWATTLLHVSLAAATLCRLWRMEYRSTGWGI